ncbi:MAG: AMP-binding protein [Candidatus Bipolaricaulota bacterium]|nr:AMP-binding protein [Candidatus Bipolaricaulota bacterium]MDW8110610.1 AMP-binding protein [Candidatus Bipolaricaulota bacterium]MDW8329857.1 AMP-binding protein [Candidatus Bipolaricaulota bacterium]
MSTELSWVGDWSGRRAMLTPTREALYDATSNSRYTYAQLDERANRVGTYLRDVLALQPGDVVAFLSRNRVEPIDLYFATGKLGLILAPLSYRLAPPELDHLLARIKPKVLFYEEHFQTFLEKLTLPPVTQATISWGSPNSPYERIVLTTPPRPVNRAKSLDAVHLYIHTGGTTGLPKICLVSYRQMLWNSISLIATGAGQSGINQKELLTFPLFHIGGWNTVTPVFHIGGQVTLIREFDPDLILELIEREKITHFGGVEAMLRMIASRPRFAQTDFSSLEYITSAGAPCSTEVMRPFWEKGVLLTQAYGLTEGGPSNFFFVPVGRDWKTIQEKSQSIGFPMFHCDCKLVDPQTGQVITQAGEIGELWFRGPHTFEGYLDDPERTARVRDPDGWIHSGDLARYDEDGFYYIVGRVDNMYISGGENISPEELEPVIAQHPAVAQVAVVGVPDEQWGAVGLAAVVVRPGHTITVEELRDFCRQRLGGFKVPKYFKFVDELPLSGPGKINRKILRERFLKGEL